MGLGRLLDHVRDRGWVEGPLLDDIAVVCERRKPFGHWRRAFDPGTPGRRMADLLRAGDDDPHVLTAGLLAADAAFAVTTTLRLYFGNYFGGPFE